MSLESARTGLHVETVLVADDRTSHVLCSHGCAVVALCSYRAPGCLWEGMARVTAVVGFRFLLLLVVRGLS